MSYSVTLVRHSTEYGIEVLKSVGISGSLLDWLSNYLENRRQRVCLQNCTSTWRSINAGASQGSILGPLLFLIFTNHIVNIVGEKFVDLPAIRRPMTEGSSS